MDKTCKVQSCNRAVHAKGFCTRCYMRYRRGIIDNEGTFLRQFRFLSIDGETFQSRRTHCRVCGNFIVSGKGGSLSAGLCSTHYWQWKNGIIDVSGKVRRKRYIRT